MHTFTGAEILASLSTDLINEVVSLTLLPSKERGLHDITNGRKIN